jgi:hypothetical protein
LEGEGVGNGEQGELGGAGRPEGGAALQAAHSTDHLDVGHRPEHLRGTDGVQTEGGKRKDPGVAQSHRSLGTVREPPEDPPTDSADLDDLCDAIKDWDQQACDLSVSQTTPGLEEKERTPPEPPPVSGVAGGRTCLTLEQEGSVAHIAATIAAFFPERSGVNELEEMKAVALRAFKRADLDFNIDDAVRVAGDFHMEEGSCERDCAEFDLLPRDEQGMVDIGPMVESRKSKLAPNRMSRRRVEQWLSRNNPFFERVMRVAEGGIVVGDLLPADFETCGPEREKWPALRPKFLKAAPAVETLMQTKFVDKGLAILLDTTRAQLVKGLSVHASGWAVKAKKPLGRNTGDPNTMNTVQVKEGADRL